MLEEDGPSSLPPVTDLSVSGYTPQGLNCTVFLLEGVQLQSYVWGAGTARALLWFCREEV